MTDISKLEQQADLLFDNIAGWEQSTLQRIGKRIKQYGRMSVEDVKSINNIAVVKQDLDDIIKELAKVTGKNITMIEKIYSDLIEEQHLANKPLSDYRNKAFMPFASNLELQAVVKAFAKSTGETMINLAKTKALCVLDNNGNVKGLQKYYTDVLDKAVMQVTSGAADFHTAMRDSIIELGGSGMRVDYGGSVTRRLDTAVRQNLLWGAKQTSVEYNEMIGEELGCDGYEIDYHANSRPSHEFMQGRQFCVGNSKTIAGQHFDGMEDTRSDISGKNVTESLQDYGCLHYKTPIFCGISEPRYFPEELIKLKEEDKKTYNINGKKVTGYEAQQMMRRIETAIRKERSIKQTAQASGSSAIVRDCNANIKALKNKYDEIVNTTGFAPELKRMSVPKLPKK